MSKVLAEGLDVSNLAINGGDANVAIIQMGEGRGITVQCEPSDAARAIYQGDNLTITQNPDYRPSDKERPQITAQIGKVARPLADLAASVTGNGAIYVLGNEISGAAVTAQTMRFQAEDGRMDFDQGVEAGKAFTIRHYNTAAVSGYIALGEETILTVNGVAFDGANGSLPNLEIIRDNPSQ